KGVWDEAGGNRAHASEAAYQVDFVRGESTSWLEGYSTWVTTTNILLNEQRFHLIDNDTGFGGEAGGGLNGEEWHMAKRCERLRLRGDLIFTPPHEHVGPGRTLSNSQGIP
ncbi:17345_t:CDS:2, partial [Acaulospora colombiana]